MHSCASTACHDAQLYSLVSVECTEGHRTLEGGMDRTYARNHSVAVKQARDVLPCECIRTTPVTWRNHTSLPAAMTDLFSAAFGASTVARVRQNRLTGDWL